MLGDCEKRIGGFSEMVSPASKDVNGRIFIYARLFCERIC